jgi:hypothetical protein
LQAEAGHFVALPGQGSQLECLPGSYQPGTGATSCLEAEAGNFVALPAQAAQTQCYEGTYQPNKGAMSCLEAEVGHFVASRGQTAQTPCSPGSYQPRGEEPACLPAQKGFYVSSSGSATETQCPPLDTTAGTGSTSASQCVLKPLEIETTSLPGAKRGTPYTDQLKASGGIPSYKWKKVGGLPKGLKLSNTGLISGTPSTKLAAGSYSIGVKVTDSKKKGKDSTTATFTLKVS